MWCLLRERVVFARKLVGGFFAVLVLFNSAAFADSITYQYDALGRVNQTIDSSGNVGNYQYDATGNLLSVKATVNNTLQVLSFNPQAAAPGDSIVVQGTGFSATASQDIVTFAGGLQGTVTQASTTQLTVTVPAVTSIGYFHVNNGSASTASPAVFIPLSALAAPTITSFSPTMGSAGTSVVITGTNFDATAANDNVIIGGITAPVTAATVSQLTVSAPAGAVGKVVVETKQGSATSSQDYISLPSGVSAANVAFTGRLTINGTALSVTTPPSGKQALLVFNGMVGQQLTIVAASSSYAGKVSLKVYTPGGKSIFSGSLGINGIGRFPNLLPSTGNYVVVLTPGSTDSGTISLGLISDTSGTLQVGGATTIKLGVGQGGEYTFTAAANMGYGLGIANLNLSSGMYIVYLDSATTKGLYACSIGGDAASCHFDSSNFGTAGTYTLRFVPSGAIVGNFTASFSADANAGDLAGPTNPVTTIVGQAVTGTFSASQGQSLTLVVTNDSIATTTATTSVEVFKPSDPTHVSPVVSASMVAGNWPFVMSDLPDTGIYVVLLEPDFSAALSGSVTMQVKSDATGQLNLGGTTSISLAAGQSGRYTFTAAANTGYGLGVTNPSSEAYITVYLDSATTKDLYSCTVGFSSSTSCHFDSSYFGTAGTYTLRFVPSGVIACNFTASFSADANAGDLAVSTSPVTTIAGQAVAGTFSASQGQSVTLTVTNNSIATASLTTAVLVFKPSDPRHVSPFLRTEMYSGSSTFVLSRLPDSGTYSVVLVPDSLGASSGSVTLQTKSE